MKRGCIRWGWACPSVALSLLLGCSSNSGPAAGAPLPDDTGGTRLDAELPDNPCSDPTSVDCPCAEEGARLECGEVQEVRGDYVICSLGTRSCNNGLWSECTPERLVEAAAADAETTPGGLRLQALSAGVDCKNLCDPRCVKHVDTADGLSVGANLEASTDGLTLPDLGSGGNCNNITLTPPSATVTVTGIDPTNGAITVSPASVSFAATCNSGLPIQPSWSMDAYDRAIIDANGKVTPFSGIGSPILVTAKSAKDTSTALVDVRVQIDDYNGLAAADAIRTAFTAAALPPTVLSADVGKTLYPYRNTVFPLDLKAPLVQWETGGTPAAGVRVALRFPAGSASPTFWYSKMFKSATADPKDGTLSNTVPAWQVPQEIWSAFDRSAAGSAVGGEILVQRIYSSVVHELKIPVKFATEALPGTVYYTQYRRQFSNTCPTAAQPCTYNSGSYAPGQICEVGSGNHPSTATYPSTLRAIDLGQRSAPNKDPFVGTTKCPVCHSVSANGNTFVAGSQGWVQTGTPPQPVPGKSINSIGLSVAGDPLFTQLGSAIAPTYTGLSDTGAANGAGDPYNNQERVGENSRGFAYNAITPDGSLVLQGASFWGNTQDTPSSGTLQDAALKGLTGAVKPYFFARTDQPGVGVQFATTGALPTPNSFSAGVFTSTSGSLTVDGYTLIAVDQSVLVKDESNAAHNGVYVLSQVSPWKLTRRYDADAASELKQYTEVRVTDGNANRGRAFYVSSASPATLNSSNISFAERIRPVSFTAAPVDVDYATSGALPGHSQNINPTPPTVAPAVLSASGNGVLQIDGINMVAGKTVLVKDEGSPSSENGIYAVSLAGSSTSKWKLARRSDADQTGELSSRKEVRVGSGTSNLGKVFYLSSPASGAITLDTITNTATSWSLQTLPTMMVPVISPDGNRIAYVNGDADSTPGLDDTGWRRGLSMLSFEQDTMTVSKKVRLLNNYPSSGVPFKWPFFESDSRSLIYVETESGEYCNAADSNRSNSSINLDIERACADAAYGSMSPTTRGYWKGKLFSIDTNLATPSSTGTRVELSKLNDGDDDGGTDDFSNADHNYQPTVLPFDKGGYRWAIFTSTRAYGNQLNQSSGSTPTHFTCAASTLWMAAIDNVTASTSDRSHPAFLLPGQNLAKINDAAPHYINERGYLVPSPCKSSGLSCTSNSECCGGSGSAPSAACRAPLSWTPASGPPAKTCSAIGGTCSLEGESCGTPADCCSGGAACVNFLCTPPPSYKAASFERTYDADCPDSYQPSWTLLSYYLTTGSDSKLDFSVQTANDLADLDTAPVIVVGSSDKDAVSPATPDFQDLGKALTLANSNGLNHLRLLIDFLPSADKQTAPILHDWEVRYTCEAAQ